MGREVWIDNTKIGFGKPLVKLDSTQASLALLSRTDRPAILHMRFVEPLAGLPAGAPWQLRIHHSMGSGNSLQNLYALNELQGFLDAVQKNPGVEKVKIMAWAMGEREGFLKMDYTPEDSVLEAGRIYDFMAGTVMSKLITASFISCRYAEGERYEEMKVIISLKLARRLETEQPFAQWSAPEELLGRRA